MHIESGTPPRVRALLLTLIGLLVLGRCAAAAATAGTLPRDMRERTTKHYVIHTNIKGEFADELAKRLDVMYDEYTRRLKEFSPPGEAPKLPVYLFNTAGQYQAFTGSPGMGGVFVAHGDKSYLAAHVDPLGRDELRRTLQHEGFHQFAYATIGPKLPLWLNEGIAELFNDGIWTGRRFLLGEVRPHRVRRLQHAARTKSLVPLKDLVAVTSERWHEMARKNPDHLQTYYNQSWGLVYFLGESGREAHRKRLLEFLRKIHGGEEADAAWKKSFPDTTQLQNEFARWAMTLRPTAGATMIERQETLASMLIGCHKSGRTFESMSQFRNYVITSGLRRTRTEGKMKWTTSDRPAEYFESPAGELYDTSTQLFFEPAAGRPLPDIVCRAAGDAHFRTRFYRDGAGNLQHEVFIVSIRGG